MYCIPQILRSVSRNYMQMLDFNTNTVWGMLTQSQCMGNTNQTNSFPSQQRSVGNNCNSSTLNFIKNHIFVIQIKTWKAKVVFTNMYFNKNIQSHIPLVVANFKCITTKFPFGNLRKLFYFPSIFPMQLRWFWPCEEKRVN